MSAPQQHAQAALSDEQIDTIAKPYAGLGGIENYRAFSRAILAASQKSAALADSRSRENENDAPAVQVQDERAAFEVWADQAGHPFDDTEDAFGVWKAARAALTKGQK